VLIDALDLAVSKDRLKEKLNLTERIMYWDPRTFLRLESCSTFTSLNHNSSNSSKTASQWYLDNTQQEEICVNIEEIQVQDFPGLSSHGDIYQ